MELAKIVRDLLKPFLFVTKLLSSENQTTLDMVLHVSLYLRHKITTFECENENAESPCYSILLIFIWKNMKFGQIR